MKAEKLSPKEKVELCFNAVLEKKAIDPKVLDVGGLTSVTDYFLICSGSSSRQVQAIADFVEETLRIRGLKSYRVEGYDRASWILIDCDDVVVHIFHEDTRPFYDLERLWADAPRLALELPTSSDSKMRGDRSG